jgi:hypothetical protein
VTVKNNKIFGGLILQVISPFLPNSLAHLGITNASGGRISKEGVGFIIFIFVQLVFGMFDAKFSL